MVVSRMCEHSPHRVVYLSRVYGEGTGGILQPNRRRAPMPVVMVRARVVEGRFPRSGALDSHSAH